MNAPAGGHTSCNPWPEALLRPAARLLKLAMAPRILDGAAAHGAVAFAAALEALSGLLAATMMVPASSPSLP